MCPRPAIKGLCRHALSSGPSEPCSSEPLSSCTMSLPHRLPTTRGDYHPWIGVTVFCGLVEASLESKAGLRPARRTSGTTRRGTGPRPLQDGAVLVDEAGQQGPG